MSGSILCKEMTQEAGTDERPAGDAPSAARRLATFFPTTASGLLMAVCFFLPVGMYGCGSNPPQPRTPSTMHAEAIAELRVSEALTIGMPYLLGLAIGVGAAVTAVGSVPAIRRLWLMYLAIALALVLMLVALVAMEWSRSSEQSLRDFWRDQGLVLLAAFWLLNVSAAVWLEARSVFLAALMLQLALVPFVWVGLARWLLFLDRLLLGGWITLVCALVLPVGTLLQLYGCADWCRATRRQAPMSSASLEESELPQFSLAGLLLAMALCPIVLTVGQVLGLEAGIVAALITPFAVLTWRGCARLRRLENRPRMLPLATLWYAAVAVLLALGGLAVL